MNRVCKIHQEHDPICRECVVVEGFVLNLYGKTRNGTVVLRYHKGDVLLATGDHETMRAEYMKYEALVPEYEWDSPADQSDVLRQRAEVFERIWQANPAAEPAPKVKTADELLAQAGVMPKKTTTPQASGDRWRLELEYVKPGETFVVVYIDGEQQCRVPIGNLLEAHARFDPGAAAGREQLIAQLRGEVGDWKSKYYNRVGAEAELDQARVALAKAESELKALREAQPARVTHPAACGAATQVRVLLKACRAQMARCPRCKGNGEVSEVTGMLDQNDGIWMPCPACATFRELVNGIAAESGT